MQSRDALELFGERVAAVKHLLSEASYAEIIEIFAYILGSILAEADPEHVPALRRHIGKRIAEAAQRHRALRNEPETKRHEPNRGPAGHG